MTQVHAAPPLSPPFAAPFPVRSAADVQRLQARPMAAVRCRDGFRQPG